MTAKQDTKTRTIEVELNCPECGLVAVDTFEVLGIRDGRGYVCCYDCGTPKEVEVP